MLCEPGELLYERAAQKLELRLGRQRAASEREPARLADSAHVTGGQERGVRAYGPHPDGYSVRDGPELVYKPTGLLSGDPPRPRDGEASVE